MFDVGFGELVLLFVIGLLVLGPQRLPKVAAEIGKWVGRARRTATQLRRQLEREIELADLEANNPSRQTPPASGENQPPASSTHGDPTVPAPAEPATTRQISDAISDHAAPPAVPAESKPRESTDKPPSA